MLSTTHLISDTQLSNADASELILANAIEQLAAITGLTAHQSQALLVESMNQQPQNATAVLRQPAMLQTNIIDQNESAFIGDLFKD